MPVVPTGGTVDRAAHQPKDIDFSKPLIRTSISL